MIAGIDDKPVRVPFLRDSRLRGGIYQFLVLAGLLLLIFWISENVAGNLERIGITLGFEFLKQKAGFDISQSLYPYEENSTYGDALCVGFFNTLLLALVGIVIASIIGFLVGIGRLSRNWLLRSLCAVYVDVFRNIPPLLVVFFWYFGVLSVLPLPAASIDLGFLGYLNNRGFFFPKPIWEGSLFYLGGGTVFGLVLSVLVWRWATIRQVLTGKEFPRFWSAVFLIGAGVYLGFVLDGHSLSFQSPKLGVFNMEGGLQVFPEFVSLSLALSFYTAAFIAEIVRSGVLGVGNGQVEAAASLGLIRSQSLRFIVVPQALRFIIPALTSQYLNITKNSSLAVAVGYPDLVSVGGTIFNQTGKVLEVIFITMAVYLFLSLSASAFMNWFNARMKLVGS